MPQINWCQWHWFSSDIMAPDTENGEMVNDGKSKNSSKVCLRNFRTTITNQRSYPKCQQLLLHPVSPDKNNEFGDGTTLESLLPPREGLYSGQTWVHKCEQTPHHSPDQQMQHRPSMSCTQAGSTACCSQHHRQKQNITLHPEEF